MAFDFPNSPTEGQEYTPIPNGASYVWSGGRWNLKSGDAPSDGKQYARSDGGWEEVTGFPEAPIDGEQYVRQDAAWSQVDVPPGTMISDTPPAGPEQGQLWWESDSGDMFIWYDDGSGAQWVQVNGPGYAVVAISDAPPASPIAGTLWFESDSGRLWTWYTDVDSSQWVQIAGPAAPMTFLSFPAGVGIDWWGTTAPPGTLFCFGQAVSRTTYAALFLEIGTTYGAGDGSTTFLLPDCRGRVIAGKDDMGGTSANRLTGTVQNPNGDLLGAVGGTEGITLSVGHLPSGTLDVRYSGNNIFMNAGGGGYRFAFTTDGSGTPIRTQPMGSDAPHGNVQPTIIANKLITTGGVV